MFDEARCSICGLGRSRAACVVVAMAFAYVRVLNGISGAELLPQTRMSCAPLISTLLGLLGSRPSRPVQLFCDGLMVDGLWLERLVFDGAYIEFTAICGDALSIEDREGHERDLSQAFEIMGWCCHVFSTFSIAARDDRALVVFAVGLDPDCLEVASEALRDDKEIVLLAVCHHTGDRSDVLKWASLSLRNDKDVVLAGLANDDGGHTCLEYASEELRMDKALVLFAMRTGGWLEFVPFFQNDKAVVLAAVRSCGVSLEFASEALQNDKEVVLAAMQENGYGLQYASEALRDDEEIVSAAVRGYADDPSHVLCFASLRLHLRG